MDALKKSPQRFRTEDAQQLVVLTEQEYMELLAKGNVTAPAHWPPGKQDGARLLARIREIERDCVKAHGKWNWELLPENLQDEYDVACIDLNELIEPDDGEWVSIEELARELSRSMRRGSNVSYRRQ